LQIVRPIFPDLDSFKAPFQAALASGQVTNNGVGFKNSNASYRSISACRHWLSATARWR
jgi:hypothetical protein